jgi:hypothetical protein
MKPSLLLLFTAGMLCAAVPAPDHPDWRTLDALFGQPIDSTLVQAVGKKHSLAQGQKFDSGELRPADNAYTILYRENRVECIILRLWSAPGYGDPGWKFYAPVLPFGLKATDDLDAMEKKLGLGDPPRSGHVQHDDYRLTLLHERGDTRIEELYIRKKDKTPRPLFDSAEAEHSTELSQTTNLSALLPNSSAPNVTQPAPASDARK